MGSTLCFGIVNQNSCLARLAIISSVLVDGGRTVPTAADRSQNQIFLIETRIDFFLIRQGAIKN